MHQSLCNGLYFPLTDWLIGSVVYAQIYELRVVGSNRGITMLWRFFAISPLVKLLVLPNRSIVITIVTGGGGGGSPPPPPTICHMWGSREMSMQTPRRPRERERHMNVS